MDSASYFPILRTFRFRPTLRYPWAVVGHTRRTEGWKLHLSSVPSQAPRLLRTVLPTLREHKSTFKLAQDEAVVGLLNEGELGATQVGKFLTIYPESDEHARALADRLIARTGEFSGPEIVTDLRLGSIVYARYGSFRPVIRHDRLGHAIAMIHAGDGSLIPDRYTVPFTPPTGVANPFADLARGGRKLAPDRRSSSPRHLLGPGYLVVDSIKARPYGGALLAIDLRSQDTVALKVLKHGRPHCLSDAYGRDIRDRLKRQAILHATLSARVPIPEADAYFEVDEHGYLPIQHLEGRNFEHLVASRLARQPWSHLAAGVQRELLQLIERGISAVRRLHAAGYIHRDLSPSNLWIGHDGTVSLLDLELAHRIGDSTPAFGLGTAGFMSPQQAARESPAVTDDVFAVGCLLTFLLTGLDPRRVVFSFDRHRRRRLARLMKGVPSSVLDVVCACLAVDPSRRPELGAVEELVAACASGCTSVHQPVRGRATPPPLRVDGRRRPALLRAVLERGQESLLNEVRGDDGRLWLSARLTQSGRAGGSYEVMRYANRGVAGVVYVLARLARFDRGSTAARRCVRGAASWLLDTEPSSTDRLPGLHFGEAGVAVAIAEAVAAGYVSPDERVSAFLRRSLNGKLDWPDITHGAAGQGIAAMYCSDLLDDPALASAVHRCADFLVSTQGPDGSWVMPAGIDGLSDQTLTGFAHGVAGMAFFLAEYERRFRRSDVARALESATAWTVAHAERAGQDRTLEWPYSTTTPDRWHWWCHGGPGIALLFLKLYEHTGDERHADVARRALQGHPPEVRYPNLSQCHGLSGLGEVYLEAARVLGDPEWGARARRIGDELLSLAREQDDGSICWLVEDPYRATCDLMVGYGGVLHFLLRQDGEGKAAGFPLLLDGAGA